MGPCAGTLFSIFRRQRAKRSLVAAVEVSAIEESDLVVRVAPGGGDDCLLFAFASRRSGNRPARHRFRRSLWNGAHRADRSGSRLSTKSGVGGMGPCAGTLFSIFRRQRAKRALVAAVEVSAIEESDLGGRAARGGGGDCLVFAFASRRSGNRPARHRFRRSLGNGAHRADRSGAGSRTECRIYPAGRSFLGWPWRHWQNCRERPITCDNCRRNDRPPIETSSRRPGGRDRASCAPVALGGVTQNRGGQFTATRKTRSLKQRAGR